MSTIHTHFVRKTGCALNPEQLARAEAEELATRPKGKLVARYRYSRGVWVLYAGRKMVVSGVGDGGERHLREWIADHYTPEEAASVNWG